MILDASIVILGLAAACALVIAVRRREWRLLILTVVGGLGALVAVIAREDPRHVVPAWGTVLLALLILVAALVMGWLVVERDRARARSEALLAEMKASVDEASSQIESGEARLREILRLFPGGIFETDASGVCVSMNGRWRELTETSRSASRGNPWTDPIVPEDQARIREAFEDARNRHATLLVEYRIGRGGTPPLWVETQMAPRLGPSQEAMGWIGVTIVIEERKRAEEERRVLDRRLQAAQRLESLGLMAGGVAHDFNNLLVGVLGNASLASERLDPALPEAEAVRRIEEAALRASALTRQMLTFAGRETPALRAVDLDALIQESRDLLGAAIGKRHEIVIEAGAEVAPVLGDPGQLGRILLNLLTNAAEAMESGPGRITIRTGMVELDAPGLAAMTCSDGAEPGRFGWFEVADGGKGIAPEALPRIFDPFFSTKFEGRGLGLAATLGIVRGHRGAVRIRSEVGSGTGIAIFIPVAGAGVAGPAPAPAPPALAPGIPAAPAGKEGAVLVVDDDEAVLTLAARMLELRGFRVVTAGGGEAALRCQEELGPALRLAVLDLSMPKMDGAELARRLRACDPGLRIILTSGHSESGARQTFGATEVSGFLQKPYRAADLVSVVRSALAP